MKTEKKTLCQADLCEAVFCGALTYTKEGLEDYRQEMHAYPASKEAIAIGHYVKTHRINVGNVAEVIRVMWPEATMTTRRDPKGEGDREIQVDVKFPDGSYGLMFSNDGIFDEYTTMGWAS